MTGGSTVIAAAVIGSSPGWAGFFLAARSNRRQLSRQTDEIRQATAQQTDEIKAHLGAPAALPPPDRGGL